TLTVKAGGEVELFGLGPVNLASVSSAGGSDLSLGSGFTVAGGLNINNNATLTGTNLVALFTGNGGTAANSITQSSPTATAIFSPFVALATNTGGTTVAGSIGASGQNIRISN